MDNIFSFKIKRTQFDENYSPAETTRLTTNFANLARGPKRKENLSNTLRMINNRFNALAHWDNVNANRYCVSLEIISVDIAFKGATDYFPNIEILQSSIVDTFTSTKIEGVVGNNFSSYIRDYDFSVLLSKHNKGKKQFTVPEGFGDLHGKLFQLFINSETYKNEFSKLPVICLSVSENKTYTKTDNLHPVLGTEYVPDSTSLTEAYFKKMGLNVRYFMPDNSAAPLAFYFCGDLLNGYTNLELVSAIATMETFQKIYRPEIYNANTAAGRIFQPKLSHQDHSYTTIVYDRQERTELAIAQGEFVEKEFIKPHQTVLNAFSTQTSL